MSECSAKNLGLKATNQRRGSFASGQRHGVNFFLKHVLPGCFNVIGCLVYKKTLLPFVLN